MVRPVHSVRRHTNQLFRSIPLIAGYQGGGIHQLVMSLGLLCIVSPCLALDLPAGERFPFGRKKRLLDRDAIMVERCAFVIYISPFRAAGNQEKLKLSGLRPLHSLTLAAHVCCHAYLLLGSGTAWVCATRSVATCPWYAHLTTWFDEVVGFL
jgi:hypothetical protein